MIDTEPEVIAKLDSVPNKSKYIKDLIKADIEKGAIKWEQNIKAISSTATI